MYLYRVVWVFGECVRSHITDVTPTHLTQQVLATLREADHIAQSILKSHGMSCDSHLIF